METDKTVIMTDAAPRAWHGACLFLCVKAVALVIGNIAS